MSRFRVAAALVAALVLAACDAKGKAPPVAAQPALADSADQLMFGVRFTLANAGIRRADVRADTAYMYDENTRTDMRHVNAVFYALTGARDGTLTSKKGTYDVRLGSMEARGNVIIISERGAKLESQQVRYEPNKNEVSSDSAFVLTRADGSKLTGVGFVSDPNLKNIRVLRAAQASNVKANLPQR